MADDPEIILPNGNSSATSRLIPPPVKLNLSSTVQSPFFWLLIGLIGGYYLRSRHPAKTRAD